MDNKFPPFSNSPPSKEGSYGGNYSRSPSKMKGGVLGENGGNGGFLAGDLTKFGGAENLEFLKGSYERYLKNRDMRESIIRDQLKGGERARESSMNNNNITINININNEPLVSKQKNEYFTKKGSSQNHKLRNDSKKPGKKKKNANKLALVSSNAPDGKNLGIEGNDLAKSSKAHRDDVKKCQIKTKKDQVKARDSINSDTHDRKPNYLVCNGLNDNKIKSEKRVPAKSTKRVDHHQDLGFSRDCDTKFMVLPKVEPVGGEVSKKKDLLGSKTRNPLNLKKRRTRKGNYSKDSRSNDIYNKQTNELKPLNMKEFINPVWLSNIMKNPFQYARENEVLFYQHGNDRNSAGQPQYYCNLRPPYPGNYNPS